jgi:predicted SAM-dependent methyltransferase
MSLVSKVFLKLFKKKISLSQLKNSKNSGSPLRLIIGSGYTLPHGWIITDIETLNIVNQNDWRKYFNTDSISSVVAEHVFEHLISEDRDNALKNIYNHLLPKGNLRIAVPDGYHIKPAYIEAVKPNGTGEGAPDHKFLYNYQTLSEVLRRFGFTVNLLEYYDENGKFHFEEWDHEKGPIHRSLLNDARNENGVITYSSLLLDAVK